MDFSAIAGVIAGVSSAITAWQSENSASRKINRCTNAIIALKNHILWWNGLTPVDQNSLININRLVMLGEQVKMSEVSSWADASRQKEAQTDEGNGDIQHSVVEPITNPMFEG